MVDKIVKDALVQKPIEDATPPKENAPVQPDEKTFQQRFIEFAAPIINCNVRGLMSVTLGAPFQITVICICNVFGQVLSAMTAVGMLTDVLKLRADCREAFNKGLDSITPQAPTKIPSQSLNSNLMNGTARR